MSKFRMTKQKTKREPLHTLLRPLPIACALYGSAAHFLPASTALTASHIHLGSRLYDGASGLSEKFAETVMRDSFQVQ